MKKIVHSLFALLVVLASCKEDDVNLFDESADDRARNAIAALKQELIAPANGWRVKYEPQEGAGSFYVLMDFNENDNVVIRTDLAASNGEYLQDTIPFRVDNSLGLELILETYSFFSFLFEQDAATFGAEYEFNFVNKTPDNALVFRSKSDVGIPGIILFEEASGDDVNLLGVELGENLETLSNDLDKFTSSLKLTYNNKDLALYLSLNHLKRTLTVTSASLKTNTSATQTINFSTSYLLEGNRMIFDEPLQGTILGSAVTVSSLQLGAVGENILNICAEPISLHSFSGTTSANEAIVLETSLTDVSGPSFAQLSDFYVAPLGNIFNNGVSAGQQIPKDISGALAMQLYYNNGTGSLSHSIGFVIQNPDGSISWALRAFTPVLNENNLVLNFEPEITVTGASTAANVANVNIYLDALTSGDQTYVFQLQEHVYEFYNPCSGWSFVFINVNQ